MSWNSFINKITGKKADEGNVMRFRTNIMCNGCIAKVTPVLDAMQGITSWSVALDTPDRVLSIVTDTIGEEEILSAVRAAGFTIERM